MSDLIGDESWGAKKGGPAMRFSGLRIWRRSTTFWLRNAVAVLPILPLLWLPLLSDLLHSILIRDEQGVRPLAAGRALGEALRLLPRFVQLKVYYFGRALLWSVVPLYGLIRDIDERLRWAMASNVFAFEGPLDFAAAKLRCEELAANYRGEAIRVLLTVPVLASLAAILMLALATTGSVIVAAVVLFWYLAVPGSAAANSYLYVWASDAGGAADQEWERIER